jgi:ATP-dependent Zn protease
MSKATKSGRPTALTCTAYHEAGHVVIAAELQLPFRHATIVPDEDRGSLGHMLHELSDFAPDEVNDEQARQFFERHILCSWGGPIAEAFVAGRHNWRGARGDEESIKEMALKFCNGADLEATAYSNWLYIRAKTILVPLATWRAVEGVANALLEHRQLEANQLIQIVRDQWLRMDKPSDQEQAALQQRRQSIEG